jgi:hypothetical protein
MERQKTTPKDIGHKKEAGVPEWMIPGGTLQIVDLTKGERLVPRYANPPRPDAASAKLIWEGD